MELEHSFTVPVPRSRAWDVLLDVERVAPCMPGATIDSVDGDEIRGKIKVKVGPINMTYAGIARFVEKDKESGVVRLEASGKETRGAGTATASVRSELQDRGDQTDVVVLTTLNVTGKPAQFGRGVMNEVGGKLLTIFATNLAALLAEPEGAATEPAAADATPTGTDEGVPQDEVPEEGAAEARAAAHPDLDAPLADLKLPTRIAAVLSREGITSLADLVAKSRTELLAIDGIGRSSFDDIAAKLAERGLTVGQPTAPVPIPTGAVPSQPTRQTATADMPVTAGAPAATGAAAGSTVSGQGHPAAPQAAHHYEDDALNLLKVAGLPVLKRAIPVLAGVAAALLIAMRRRLRHRRRRHHH
jgi:carbon monoxide dehydrogenase subunit G